MRFSLSTAILATLATLSSGSPTPSSGQQMISVGYSLAYDEPNRPMTSTSCSNGENGLLHQGYTKLSDIRNYPDVGSVYTIEGWNSPNCGKCYELRYKDRTIFFTAIDHAVSGAYISHASLDYLTDGRAYEAGRVDAWISPAPEARCMYPRARQTWTA